MFCMCQKRKSLTKYLYYHIDLCLSESWLMHVVLMWDLNQDPWKWRYFVKDFFFFFFFGTHKTFKLLHKIGKISHMDNFFFMHALKLESIGWTVFKCLRFHSNILSLSEWWQNVHFGWANPLKFFLSSYNIKDKRCRSSQKSFNFKCYIPQNLLTLALWCFELLIACILLLSWPKALFLYPFEMYVHCALPNTCSLRMNHVVKLLFFLSSVLCKILLSKHHRKMLTQSHHFYLCRAFLQCTFPQISFMEKIM